MSRPVRCPYLTAGYADLLARSGKSADEIFAIWWWRRKVAMRCGLHVRADKVRHNGICNPYASKLAWRVLLRMAINAPDLDCLRVRREHTRAYRVAEAAHGAAERMAA